MPIRITLREISLIVGLQQELYLNLISWRGAGYCYTFSFCRLYDMHILG